MHQWIRASIASALLLAASSALGQQRVEHHLSFSGKQWEGTAEVATVAGTGPAAVLELKDGRLWLAGDGFSEGVVEMEVALPHGFGFSGFMFDASDRSNFEEFYFRQHLSGQPDAVQYSPVNNGISAWQLFTGPGYWHDVRFSNGGWHRVRFENGRGWMRVFFDGDLTLENQTRLGDTGKGFGFESDFAPIRLRNVTFASLSSVATPKIVPAKPLNASPFMRGWEVTGPFAESSLAEKAQFPTALVEGRKWRPIAAEPEGLFNLARLFPTNEGADTVLLRRRIDRDSSSEELLTFGYSDRVRIFLNGGLLFDGDAGWRSRDPKFLGTIALKDRVPLYLRAGSNDLVVALSETFGGWGWTASLAPFSTKATSH
jgi:hypothetical protein